MPDWDEDSPQLRQNLNKALDEIVLSAQRRECPTVASARRWQSLVMKSLVAPDARFVGAFRGESGLEKTQVRVGAQFGVDAAEVAQELLDFETMLHALIRELDAMVAAGQEPDADQLAAVLDLCAWVHAGWERIHPFANGSGRTARLWANCIATFHSFAPRPDYGYADAGARAMLGDWKSTAVLFRRMLDIFLDDIPNEV